MQPIQLELGLAPVTAPGPVVSAWGTAPAAGAGPLRPRRASPQAHRRTPPTLLVVEDEAVLRLATCRFLSRAGFRVLEAAHAAQALQVWETHHPTIDLLFTDMVMPGDMDGLELARHVLAAKPGIKVVLTSGYSEKLLNLEGLGGADLTCLAKPCAPEAVIQTLSVHLGWVPTSPLRP